MRMASGIRFANVEIARAGSTAARRVGSFTSRIRCAGRVRRKVAYQSPKRVEELAGLDAGHSLRRRSNLAVQRTVSISSREGRLRGLDRPVLLLGRQLHSRGSRLAQIDLLEPLRG